MVIIIMEVFASMEFIGIKFSENDKEMIRAIKENFPDCATLRSDELEGAEVFFVAIIPLASFGLQLLDFILNHIPKKGTSKSDQNNEAKRSFISDGKTINASELEGMNEQQVRNAFSVKLNIDFQLNLGSDNEN